MEWRPIPGYEGLYECSDTGLVKSLNYNHTKKVKELKLIMHSNGYAVVNLFKNKKLKQFCVHELVLISFGFPKEKGLEIRHLNGNNHDNNLRNLKWGTAKENCADSIKHGTHVHGSKHWSAKLNDRNIIEILKNKDKTGKFFARKFKVSKSVISKIRNRKNWKHISI